MKNYRIYDGITQYIAADKCEKTAQHILFYDEERIVKSYDVSEVRMVEELDDGMRSQRVIYQEKLESPLEQ